MQKQWFLTPFFCQIFPIHRGPYYNTKLEEMDEMLANAGHKQWFLRLLHCREKRIKDHGIRNFTPQLAIFNLVCPYIFHH